MVMMNVLCAEAFYRLGDDNEAFRRLEVADAETARGEGLLAPDIWRVRGRLLTRQGERSAADVLEAKCTDPCDRRGRFTTYLRAAGLGVHSS